MRLRSLSPNTLGAVWAAALWFTPLWSPAPAAAAPAGPHINEIRIDQPSTDVDEYAELAGPAGTSLNGLTYVVIGDGSVGSGAVEAAVSLDGLSIPGDGILLVAESSFTLAPSNVDLTTSLAFENSDNVTHLLVEGFTGAVGDDLDIDDDGTLDVLPWTIVLDAVSLVETPTSGDAYYGSSLGFVDVGPDGSFVPGHVYRDSADAWQIGAFNPTGGDDTAGQPNSGSQPPTPACNAASLTPISQVQGNGTATPLNGQQVTVEGVVTAIYPQLGGITVQEEPADEDGDPATSEGVFVFLGSSFDGTGYSRFDLVQATGAAGEFFGNTQISGAAVVCDGTAPIITPTPLSLPADFATRETLEGMLVSTSQDLVVTGLFTAYRFGELGVTPGGLLPQPSQSLVPGSQAALDLEQANADALLYIDDRGEFGNENAPWFGAAGQRAGDLIPAGTTGVLYYSFGDHLLEPVGSFPTLVSGSAPEANREPAPSLRGGNDIGAFNVLNYFNDFGNSAVLRGAENQADFDLQTAKIVDAILEMDVAALGLVELENDYEDSYDNDPNTVPAVAVLVSALNAAAGAGRYDWIRVPQALLTTEGLGGGGLGTDAIAVGILYQPARATPVGQAATLDIDALLTGADTDKNRWPLAHSFRIGGREITMVVNHFKSKGSSCDTTTVPAGYSDGQDDPQTGSCDAVREYAANRIVEWVRTKPTGVNSPDTFVVGDLNAYAQEDPIKVFERAGYQDVVKAYAGDTFTYKFDGRFGRLDYIMASPSAKRLLDAAAVWHVNAPEPYGYLYFNQPIDQSAYASSDHDPVVASISPKKPRRRWRRRCR